MLAGRNIGANFLLILENLGMTFCKNKTSAIVFTLGKNFFTGKESDEIVYLFFIC